MRKAVVYNNSEKIPVARRIIEDNPGRIWLLFTKTTDFAEATSKEIKGSKVYHSKMKLEDRERVLQEFKDGLFNVLVAVDALNEGLDVQAADSAICLSGVSTQLANFQQTGRILRPKEGKKPVFINLYTENTVEKGWVEKKTLQSGLAKFTTWSSMPVSLG